MSSARSRRDAVSSRRLEPAMRAVLGRLLRRRKETPPPPMPVIVGSPRSGTTLLRFMLDSHPDLAIPPETGFLSNAAKWQSGGPDAVALVCADILGGVAWNDFHMSADAYRAELARLRLHDPADAVRLFYRMYAARFG